MSSGTKYYSLHDRSFQELSDIIKDAKKSNNIHLLKEIEDDLLTDFSEIRLDIATEKMVLKTLFIPEEIILIELIHDKKDEALRAEINLDLAYYFLPSNKGYSFQAAEDVEAHYKKMYEENSLDRKNWSNLISIYDFKLKYSDEPKKYYTYLLELYLKIESNWPYNINDLVLDCFLPPEIKSHNKKFVSLLGKELLSIIDKKLIEFPETVDAVVLSLNIDKNYELEIPAKKQKEFLNLGLRNDKHNEKINLPYLGHTYHKAGLKFKNKDYFLKGIEYFELSKIKNPLAWPDYVYIGNSYKELAQLEPSKRKEYLALSLISYKDGYEKDKSISLLFPLIKIYFELIDEIDQFDYSKTDIIEALNYAEKAGQGFYWYTYEGLIQYYLLVNKEEEALNCLYRGWLLLAPAIEKDLKRLKAKIKNTIVLETLRKILKTYRSKEDKEKLVNAKRFSYDEIKGLNSSELLNLFNDRVDFLKKHNFFL